MHILAMTWVVTALAGGAAQDQPLPAGEILLNGGARFAKERHVSVTVRASQGATEMALSTNGTTWGQWQPVTETTDLDLGGVDGEKTVFVRFRDASGRLSGVVSAAIVLDTTPPVPKLACPEVVCENRVALDSDVPDAVGMQCTEDRERWGPWEPYAAPKTIPLSDGEGVKTVHVRYRDEAGRVSDVATVSVEVRAGARGGRVRPTVRDVRIDDVREQADAFVARLRLEASGMREMALRIDRATRQAREPFRTERLVRIPKTRGSHRVSVRLWDDQGEEHGAELHFQEEPDRQETPVGPEWPAAARPDFAPHLRARAGVWFNGLEFDSLTSDGPRSIDGGAMGLVEIDFGLNVLRAGFLDLYVEWGRGEDVTMTSFGLLGGIRVFHGELFGSNAELELHVGAFRAELDVDGSFGDFDPGVGYRVGAGLHIGAGRPFEVDFLLEFRSVAFEWSDAVVSGDKEAKAAGVALVVGAAYRF